jgi:hypothetical protein
LDSPRAASTRSGRLPGHRSAEEIGCLLELADGILVPSLCDENVCDLDTVEGDIAGGAHLDRQPDRLAQLAPGGGRIPREQLELASRHMCSASPYVIPSSLQIAFDRSR